MSVFEFDDTDGKSGSDEALTKDEEGMHERTLSDCAPDGYTMLRLTIPKPVEEQTGFDVGDQVVVRATETGMRVERIEDLEL